MTWTQPLCRACWDKERPHDRPHRRALVERVLEVCCLCGKRTMGGIYALYKPTAVNYPSED